jgi:hypothetical protein
LEIGIDWKKRQKKKVLLARMQIEDVILRYQPTLLFVEHDHRFEEKLPQKQYSSGRKTYDGFLSSAWSLRVLRILSSIPAAVSASQRLVL